MFESREIKLYVGSSTYAEITLQYRLHMEMAWS